MSKEPEYNLRNRELICKVVLFGTYLLIGAIASLLLVSFVFVHNTHVLGRLALCGGAFLYIGVAHIILRRCCYQLVAYLLVLFYTMLATAIILMWGVNAPLGLLIFGLIIVLAGILLTARHALFAAATATAILIGIQLALNLGWHQPDTSWVSSQSNFGDVAAYCTVFSMLALISWLYNQEMERSLTRAKRAEVATLQQKATLKQQVKERTAELRQAQLEEMRQMYRFAELGQLGVTLLHDLANHLSALTLEIEDLQSRQRSKAIARARQIIRYLEEIVDNTRERLHGETQKQTFNIIRKTSDVVEFLRYKAMKAEVTIEWQPPAGSWKYTGDPTYLSQIVSIIISNAIDAYNFSLKTAQTFERRLVVVTMQRNETDIIIRVADWGRGISKRKRKQLFKPFHSSKKSGLGLGLFIARQTVETHFSGTLTLSPQSDYTEFVIKLPLVK